MMMVLLRWVVRCLALVGVLLAVLATLVLEVEPRVVDKTPPDAVDAMAGRALAESIRRVIDPEARVAVWSTTEAEANGALGAAARLLTGFAGHARVEAKSASLDAAIRLPRLPGGFWLNAHVAVAPSEEGLRVSEARIGRLPLPAGLVVPAAVFLLDRALGDRITSRTLEEIEAVRIEAPRISVTLKPEGTARAALAERVRARLRELSGGADNEGIYVHLWAQNQAARRGDLSRRGSALPWLRHILQEAYARGAVTQSDEMRSALFALAIACGHERFATAIGVGGSFDSRCKGTTLGGREDLRQHFALSAGIAAASGGLTVRGVGELKELLDSNDGGSGFSFDDMAANLAGARFARTVLTRPRADWPAVIAAIDTENDLLPELDGLPSGLSDEEFEARFGDVSSASFKALIVEIERRIDALPFYAGLTPIN